MAAKEYHCGLCGRKLKHEEWIYSQHTGARFCQPDNGCVKRAARAKKKAAA